MARIMGTVNEVVCTFMIICCEILVRMRHVLDESCRENQNTRFIFSNHVPQNRAVYEIMWENMIQSLEATVDRIILLIRFAWWRCKATDIYSDYEILIAFPQ
jgi:hypothetical protein